MTRYRVFFTPEAGDQLEERLLFIAGRASPAGLRLTHHKGRTVIAYGVDAAALTVAIVGIFHGGQDHQSALTSGADDKR